MTVPDTYIHGTEPGEQQRLAALNGLTNRAFIEFLDIRSGDADPRGWKRTRAAGR